MHSIDKNEDKAGKEYWDKTERNQNVAFQPFSSNGSVRAFGKRMWHRAFLKAFSSITGTGHRLLELGCGGSAFLPYFAREFGFQVFGVDYSEQGCELARQMCAANGIFGHIDCADFFQAPLDLQGAFDVVVSFGVVEHFTDTARTLSAFAKFLRPGGLIFTTIPNMGGWVGAGQRMLAPEVFAKHEVITRETFRQAHLDAGLVLVECDYFLFTNFGVINPGSHPSFLRRTILGALKAVTGMVWAIESVVGPFPANRMSSPYLICVAHKPNGDDPS